MGIRTGFSAAVTAGATAVAETVTAVVGWAVEAKSVVTLDLLVPILALPLLLLLLL
jgi:hypothetical protein